MPGNLRFSNAADYQGFEKYLCFKAYFFVKIFGGLREVL